MPITKAWLLLCPCLLLGLCVPAFSQDAIKIGEFGSLTGDNAIACTKDFPGVTGQITINPERNANKSAVIITIKNGALHYFGTIEPKST